jgi:flagellar hook-associated protein 3 FlgL
MSLYRISTANMYENTMLNINKRQADLARSQEQLSSGKRVVKASDDAVAATLAERAQNRLSRIQWDMRALEASRTALTQAESALGEATEVLHKTRELLVQAGNPILTPEIRNDLALQLEGLREQMLAVANRQGTSGLTLFGGLGGSEKPFVDAYGPNAGVRFEGQNGQYAATETSLPQAIDGAATWMRVPQGNGTFMVNLDPANAGLLRTELGRFDATQPLPAALTPPGGQGYVIEFIDDTTFQVLDAATNTPLTLDAPATEVTPGSQTYTFTAGETIAFEGVNIELQGAPLAGDKAYIRPVLDDPGDIFQTMQNVIDALRYKGGNQRAHLPQELGRAIQELSAGMDSILVSRGRVGEWLNRSDAMQTLFKDREVFHEKEKSELTDLDFVKGISDFQSQQLALDAALKSYSQVQRLSLFQYIA